MEIPASVPGVIKKIHVKVGDKVKEGMPFIDIETISVRKEASFLTEIVSISIKGMPSLTLSPTFTWIFFITPGTDAGISIAALSLSRTTIGLL